MINRSLKCQLYPTLEQRDVLWQYCSASRWMYNHVLAVKKRYYKLYKKNLSLFKANRLIPKLRKQKRFAWLNDIPVELLRHPIIHVYKAYENFFTGIAKYPKFKSKFKCEDRFSAGQSIVIDFKGQRIKLPMIGYVRCKMREEIKRPSKISVHMHRSGKVFISILYKDKSSKLPKLPESVKLNNISGFDAGLTSLYVSSDGHEVKPKKFLKRNLDKLAKLQRAYSRKKRGSNNQKKSARRVARLHLKVANSRKFYQFLIAHHIIKGVFSESQAIQAVVVEKLSIKNMIKNPKLSRAIADAGWGELMCCIKYMCEKHGIHYIEIDPRNTSKTCHCCQFILPDKLDISVRSWQCPKCETTHNRDHNAAKVIRQRGIEELVQSGRITLSRRENPSIVVET